MTPELHWTDIFIHPSLAKTEVQKLVNFVRYRIRLANAKKKKRYDRIELTASF